MMKNNNKGFTFIELLATITILGILVTAPTCTWVSGKTNWTKSYNTWKGCSDSTSGCATDTITGKITTSAKTSTLTAYSISDNAGNTTDCPHHKINAYVDTTAPCVKLVIARNYKGPLCVDHPKTKYEYRYDIAMTDAHSGMKSTSCSGEGFSISRNVKADSILRHQGVREQFCNQKSISKITCKTCDYLDNCKKYTITAAGKQCP